MFPAKGKNAVGDICCEFAQNLQQSVYANSCPGQNGSELWVVAIVGIAQPFCL